MERVDRRLNTAWWALRLALGSGMFIAGADKYFNRLTEWTMYLSPLATRMIPVSPENFMRAAGVVEIAAALLLLTRWTKAGSYFVAAYLCSIVGNLVSTGMFYDLATRDLELAAAAFALAQLTAMREELVRISHQQEVSRTGSCCPERAKAE